MVNLDTEICRRFKEARKEKGLSQSLLSSQVGCKQSALSAFENGDSTKLSDATVAKLADKLGVSLERDEKKIVDEDAAGIVLPGMEVHGFCPDAACPSNVPYVVGEKLFFKPLRRICSPAGGKRCACCGEVLETRCPACGAVLNEGACCGVCGVPYVAATSPAGVDAAVWASARRVELSQLFDMI